MADRSRERRLPPACRYSGCGNDRRCFLGALVHHVAHRRLWNGDWRPLFVETRSLNDRRASQPSEITLTLREKLWPATRSSAGFDGPLGNVAFGREAPFHRPPCVRPQAAPKPPFHRERGLRFCTLAVIRLHAQSRQPAITDARTKSVFYAARGSQSPLRRFKRPVAVRVRPH
jgi:hypothetical protein